MPNSPTDFSPEVHLIEIANRLALRGQPSNEEFLRRFRLYYRHLAVTYGHRFGLDLDSAEHVTQQALAAKS